MPNVHLNQPFRERHDPKAIGSLNLRKGVFDAHFSIPDDVLSPLLIALAAKKLRYLVIEAAKLHYGSADAKGFSFDSNYYEDDFPPDK